MSGQTPVSQHALTATTNQPKPLRGIDYIDKGVTWTRSIAWFFIIVEIIICGSWNLQTRLGVCTSTAAIGIACYGYLMLRANKYSLWWRIPLAIMCFASLPAAIYLWIHSTHG